MAIRIEGFVLVATVAASIAACGGGGGGTGASLALLAGSPGGAGSIDGTGTAARFNAPRAVAVDPFGNVYVADTSNHVVRKVTPAGLVTTFAGFPGLSGSADGQGSTARFNLLSGIATDSAGNVYVSDSGNNKIRKITPDGTVSTLAGTGAVGAADGVAASATFNFPDGIAVDSGGAIYVVDNGNHKLRKIAGGTVSTLAGSGSAGSANGTGAAASFNFPVGVAVDGSGNIYVADTSNHTIRKVDALGSVTTLAGTALASGTTDATGAAARFNLPFGMATDAAGNIFVADTDNHTIRKVTPAGVVTTVAGAATVSGAADGAGGAARFLFPFGIAIDPSSNFVVADTGNNTIRSLSAAAFVDTLAGEASVASSADGAGSAAGFSFPFGVTVDKTGNVFVVDNGNQTLRKITAAGAVTTFVGSPGVSGNADGAGAVARFNFPVGVVPDGAGNFYFTDTSNHTIRKITAAGVATTIAGTGSPGSTDATGTAASFNQPWGIALDTAGNLYIADLLNHTIRKMNPQGAVITLAGSAGAPGSADGTGSAARFNNPLGVAVDRAGNVYVSDASNSTIRKITPGAVVTTLAGAALSPAYADGTGAAARFNFPRLMTMDSAGNILVADTNNHAIRRVTPAGEVTTVVGSSTKFGFGPGALPGTLAFPQAVAVSGGSIYITFPNGIAVVQ